jgi:hypothetical protein
MNKFTLNIKVQCAHVAGGVQCTHNTQMIAALDVGFMLPAGESIPDPTGGLSITGVTLPVGWHFGAGMEIFCPQHYALHPLVTPTIKVLEGRKPAQKA